MGLFQLAPTCPAEFESARVDLLGEQPQCRGRKRLIGEIEIAVAGGDAGLDAIERAENFRFRGRARIVVFGVLRAIRAAAPVATALAQSRPKNRFWREAAKRRRRIEPLLR